MWRVSPGPRSFFRHKTKCREKHHTSTSVEGSHNKSCEKCKSRAQSDVCVLLFSSKQKSKVHGYWICVDVNREKQHTSHFWEAGWSEYLTFYLFKGKGGDSGERCKVILVLGVAIWAEIQPKACQPDDLGTTRNNQLPFTRMTLPTLDWPNWSISYQNCWFMFCWSANQLFCYSNCVI